MRRNPRVYIAGPYRSDPVGNTAKAIEIADDLAHLGVVPFVPHLSLLWDLHRPNATQFYLDLDMEWLGTCDALYRMPGESAGADAEVGRMLCLGGPVFFDVAALLDWADQWRLGRSVSMTNEDAFAGLREHGEEVAREREEAEFSASPVSGRAVESTLRPSGGSVDAPSLDRARSLTPDESAAIEALRGRYAHDRLMVPVPPDALRVLPVGNWALVEIDVGVSEADAERLAVAAYLGKLRLVVEVS